MHPSGGLRLVGGGLEFRQRAVRLLVEAMHVHESEYEAIRHVVGKLGVSAEALRRWRCRLTTGRRSPGAKPSANEARFPPTQGDRLRHAQRLELWKPPLRT